MTPQRIAQLDALGFDWGTNATRSELEEQRWADAVAHLADYVAEHEHARVPRSSRARTDSGSGHGSRVDASTAARSGDL